MAASITPIFKSKNDETDSGSPGAFIDLYADGFTMMDNVVQQMLIHVDLNGTQHAIIHAIVQLSWRYRKDQEHITVNRLAGLMKRDRKVIQRAVAVLVEQHILLREGGILAINRDVGQWEFGSKRTTAQQTGKETSELVKKRTGRTNRSLSDTPLSGDQSVPEKGTNQSQHEGPNDPQNDHQSPPLNKNKGFEKDIPEKEICSSAGAETKKVGALVRVQQLHPEAVTATKSGSAYLWGDEVDAQIAMLIHAEVVKITLDTKPMSEKTLATWSNEVRLMVTADRRMKAAIVPLFRFAMADSFWRTVILSPSGLRKNWQKLAAKYNMARAERALQLPAVADKAQAQGQTSGLSLEQLLDNDW